jgi:hypothetical protein
MLAVYKIYFDMDEENRIPGLLELARQHMQRFRELEDIEWRINFSVWGFLGGLAYLSVNGHLKPPSWVLNWPFALLLPLPALLIHGVAIYQLNVQQQEQAKYRDKFRRQAEGFLNTKVYQHLEPKRPGGLRWRDWMWVTWDLGVTFIIAMSVIVVTRQVS